jgi:hypothetical protein
VNRQNRIWTGALLALSAAPTAPAVQLDVTPAALCSVADAVLLGHVSDLETLWAPTPEGGLERHAFVETQRILRGERAPRFEVILPGGDLGTMHHWVEDVPELRPQATYLLFLAQTAWGWEVIGGERGAVEVAPTGFGQGITIAEAVASIGGCRHAR